MVQYSRIQDLTESCQDLVAARNTPQNGTLILLSKWTSLNRNTHQKGILIKMEYSSKWNTHQNGTLVKMEPSYYYQNGTHQNGTLLLLSKWNSSKWNPHIIIKMELIKMEHSY